MKDSSQTSRLILTILAVIFGLFISTVAPSLIQTSLFATILSIPFLAASKRTGWMLGVVGLEIIPMGNLMFFINHTERDKGIHEWDSYGYRWSRLAVYPSDWQEAGWNCNVVSLFSEEK